METIYLVCLLVGGFFVALSMVGGDSESEVDADADFDAEFDSDAEADIHLNHGADGGGVSFVDLLSLRFLFLFAAFFGLTGTLLGLTGTTEPFTVIASALTGTVIGLGGNYFIKSVGYRRVSSEVTGDDLIGSTAKVLIPFSPGEKGKIRLISKGRQVALIALPLEEDAEIEFNRGDDVVVVGLKGSVAEVVKPD